ncbi:MAG: hypothetical protein ACYS8W_01015 [Planctomycetota bacterium]|jgi:hypothetical protein
MIIRQGKLPSFILLVLAALWPAADAYAQGRTRRAREKFKKVDVVIGLNHLGEHRAGWIPVCISYTVGDETFEGTIRIEFRRASRRKGLFTASRRLRFEAGQMRRIWMYAYAVPEDRNLSVRITSAGGDYEKRFASHRFAIESRDQSRTGRFNSFYRILVLASEKDKKRELLYTIDHVDTMGRGNYGGTAFLVINPLVEGHFHKSPKPLPDRVEGYGQIDLVVWNGYDIDGELSERQKNALEMWIRRGGRFMISPDSIDKLRASRFINTIVEFGDKPLSSKEHTAQVEEVKIFDEENYWGRGGRRGNPTMLLRKRVPPKGKEPKDWKKEFTIYDLDKMEIVGATRTASELNKDIIKKVRYGKGLVILLAWDISRPPYEGDSGQLLTIFNMLWQRNSEVFFHSGRDGTSRPGDNVRKKESLCGKLDSPAARLPHLALIGALVIFYIVIIGPVNYALLRRMDKRILIPITIPFLVVIYCGVITGAGYITKGFTSIQRKVTIVKLVDNCTPPYAGMATYFSIFSSGETSFSPALDPAGFGYRIFKHGKDVPLTPVHMEQDVTGWRYRDVRLINWSSAYFAGYGVRESGRKDNETKTGLITQKTESKNKVYIYNGTNFAFSGAIARVELDDTDRYVLIRKKIPEYSGVYVTSDMEYDSLPRDAIKKYFSKWNSDFEEKFISDASGSSGSDFLEDASGNFFGFLERDPLATRTEGIIEEKAFSVLVSNLPRAGDDRDN